jgi:hypothetical protein
MPNGFHGSEDEWERLEAPLKTLDGALAAYEESHGLFLSKNYHNWPERSLSWGAVTKRLIQIYLNDERHLTFNLWLCASEDRGSQRYWKKRFVKEAVPIREIEKNLNQLLDAARAEVESWTSDKLEIAGPVRG